MCGSRSWATFFIVLLWGQVRLLAAGKRLRGPLLPTIFTRSESSSVPRIIHQSWKTEKVPKDRHSWVQSWKDQHPNWQHILWTDRTNRQLVEQDFRWFLQIYDSFPAEILRADSARYMYLYKFGADLSSEHQPPAESKSQLDKTAVLQTPRPIGPRRGLCSSGVYADLDFRALKPMDGLIRGSKPKALLGRLSDDDNWTQNIPNAWMASSPGHPFWFFCLLEIARGSTWVQCEGSDCTKDYIVERTTGPWMLWRAVQHFKWYSKPSDGEVTIFQPHVLYPLSWRGFDGRCDDWRKNESGKSLSEVQKPLGKRSACVMAEHCHKQDVLAAIDFPCDKNEVPTAELVFKRSVYCCIRAASMQWNF